MTDPKKIAQDVSEARTAMQPVPSDPTTQPQVVGGDLSTSSDSNNCLVQGVLLDVDGTLVDSNDAHAQAWVEAFSALGYEVLFERVRPLIGMGGDQLVPQLIPDLSAKAGVGKQIADRRKELILHKFASTLAPTPGARDLVLKLKQAGFQLVVASSATSEELSVLLRSAQVDDLLEGLPTTTSTDASHSKPAPDLVQIALEKGQLQPQQTILLGDTPYDIEAATQSGVKVIAFRTGGFEDAQLSGALAIYDSPADLLGHYDRSVLAQRSADSVSA